MPLTVAAYETAAAQTDYPLHVERYRGRAAGGWPHQKRGGHRLPAAASGYHPRFAIAGDPVPEVAAGIDIPESTRASAELSNVISCPTCGRTSIDVTAIATRVERELADVRVPLTVAVMGCVVNGPGEARGNDLGLAGGGLAGAARPEGQGGEYAVGRAV